ncbi:hypothetical protein Taro_048155 [Colocasia esculenta]|uniref:Uncharacterized protein n=1 Tax=Colocasia esculenta TaxID=4460 RepID=A0A843WV05_COLES|nr:hypothetical protein [Colocasia esculenta]
MLLGTKGDNIHCRFLEILEDLERVGSMCGVRPSWRTPSPISLAVRGERRQWADSCPFFRYGHITTSPWGERLRCVLTHCPSQGGGYQSS